MFVECKELWSHQAKEQNGQVVAWRCHASLICMSLGTKIDGHIYSKCSTTLDMFRDKV